MAPTTAFAAQPSQRGGLATRCRDCGKRRDVLRNPTRYSDPSLRASLKRSSQNRRRSDAGSLTKQDMLWLDQQRPHGCLRCGGAAEHLDHIVPLHRGGRNERENMRWLCRSDNSSKGAKLDHEWVGEQEASYLAIRRLEYEMVPNA